MLIKNVLRDTFKKKVQLLGVILLLSLSIAIFVGFNMNSDSIRNTSESYKQNQQVADLIFYPDLKLTEEEISELIQQYQINPVELGTMPFSELILKYNIDLQPYSQKRAAELGKQYGFDFELRKEVETTSKKDGDTFNIKGIEVNENINIPYLMEGRLPETGTEITLTDSFAEANNIKVGSSFEINGIVYTVVGLAYAPDYIYPIISLKSPLYDYKTQSVAYLNEEGFKNIKGDKVSFFIGRFIDGMPSDDVLKEMKNNESFKSITIGSEIITISAVDLEIKADKVISNIFVSFLLLITAIIIVLIVRKRINGERKQIGVLKALGYSPFKIANSYLVYPIIISISGSIIGTILGYFLYPYLLNFYRGYFNIPFVTEPLNMYYVIMVVVIPLVALVLLTYLSCIQLINKKPLDLLTEGNHLKVNGFSRLINKSLKPLPFKSRFKYSLAFRSIGKLFAVAIAVFSVGLLITFSFIVTTMFNKAVEDTFQGSNFNYEVTYNQKVNRDMVILKDGEEPLTKSNLKPVLLTRSSEERVIVVPDIDTQTKKTVVTGILPEGELLVLKNSKGQLLNGLLRDGLVINEMYQMLYDIEIGDVLTFEVEVSGEIELIEIPVMGVNASFNGPIIYYDKDRVNDILGFDSGSFNGKYTLEQPSPDEDAFVQSVFSIDDLKENMISFMNITQQIMLVFVVVGSIIAIAILIIISNLIIEENKSIISLMKVLGYEEREISSILLNIYTPIVVVVYFLSVVAGLFLLKGLMSYLAKVMSVAFPVSITWIQVGIGLVILLIVYFACLFISRRSLRRISLSEALKQE